LHAIRLLSEGMTVTRTATTLGYDNPPAFTAMFVKHIGNQPKSFRNR
jgi:AraC-like DNA-binding protein